MFMLKYVNCAVLSHSLILPAATDYLKPIYNLNFFSSVVINVPWYLFLKYCCFFLFFLQQVEALLTFTEIATSRIEEAQI